MKLTRSSFVFLFLLAGLPLVTEASIGDSLTDSIQANHAKSKYRLTARFHSLGIFGYGGMIANASPAFDLSAAYIQSGWTFFIIKAVDLYDLHSPYNFSLIMVNKAFRVAKSLTFVPYGGFVIDQHNSLVGKDSDGMVFLITTWNCASHFNLEHCARFSNTCFETQFFDWLNRFRVTYTNQHLDVVASVWHNNQVFDDSQYTSLGLSIAYSRIKASDRVMLSTVVTGIKMTASTHEAERIGASGISFTIAAIWQ